MHLKMTSEGSKRRDFSSLIFISKLVLRGNPEFTKQSQRGLLFLCGGQHCFDRMKVNYSKSLRNKITLFKHHEVFFLPSKSPTLGYSRILKKFRIR